MKRFAGLYRGYLRPGKEAEYIEHWKMISSYFVAERGALGSTLHKTEEGCGSSTPDGRIERQGILPGLKKEKMSILNYRRKSGMRL